MKKKHLVFWIVLAFLLGVLACHLFYYSHSYFVEKSFEKTIKRLEDQQRKDDALLEHIDSLIKKLE